MGPRKSGRNWDAQQERRFSNATSVFKSRRYREGHGYIHTAVNGIKGAKVVKHQVQALRKATRTLKGTLHPEAENGGHRAAIQASSTQQVLHLGMRLVSPAEDAVEAAEVYFLILQDRLGYVHVDSNEVARNLQSLDLSDIAEDTKASR